jgi:plasmid replication initiation protein
MEGDTKGQMIVKANELVQAKMPLSRVEHRLVGLLISQLSKDDESFGFQKLYIKDLKDAADLSAKNLYERAEEICGQLLEKKIEVKTKEDGKRVYDGVSLMDRCKYKEGQGYIEAKFNDSMEPYLLQLKKRFTMYKVGHYVPLRSTYSMRIYELLKMREGISILRISVDELREVLGVQNSYEYFSHLEHHVIEKAQEEIGQKTDISFTYDKEKEGRSVERIKFFIHTSGDGPEETTKVEDRTEAPDIDVISMFKTDLSQEELDDLDGETVQDLHEKALKRAETENPDGGTATLQAETYRYMQRLWAS